MVDTALEPLTAGKSAQLARALARGETCRMFESDFLERFSRIHPATPFIVWLPIVALCLGSAVVHRLGGLAIAGAFFGGLLTWTLSEYFLHRYVFHWTKDTPR
ncbi:MAG TPA: hypothetical protein VKU41_13495, partial [Polyangiaceae bacterium]|nr:hypothetical protein [Polyangiaceae bacterium]